MALDTHRGESDAGSYRQVLAYRETLVLSLGLLLPRKLTEKELYSLYRRVHQRLADIAVVDFEVPAFDAFKAMIRKLIKIGEFVHTYDEELQHYTLNLSDKGQVKFDVLLINLERHPHLDKIMRIIDFYRSAPIL